MRKALRALALVPLLGFASMPAQADAIEDFYKGRTVSLIVSSPSGGGYDTLARLLVRYIARHIPGQPTVVIRNMPGAGGIV
ncbi:MAG: hypothetical protein RL735_374, partial [Pseudomonadota bacterium]